MVFTKSKKHFMKKTIFTIVTISLIFLFTKNASAQSNCCPSPDSLRISSVTDSMVCFTWRLYDSVHIGCDTPKGAVLQYRPIGATNWTTVVVHYSAGQVNITKCDTVRPCTNYQWRVRNACVVHGDTTLTDYVKGPDFKSSCDSTNKLKYATQNNVRIFPNPVKDKLTITGEYKVGAKLQISISSFAGQKVLNDFVVTSNGKLNYSVNLSGHEKGIYFITIVADNKIQKLQFLKE